MGILSTAIGFLFSAPQAALPSTMGTPPGTASATALAGVADSPADPRTAAQGQDASENFDWRATFFDYL